jgi:hypothetical protein
MLDRKPLPAILVRLDPILAQSACRRELAHNLPNFPFLKLHGAYEGEEVEVILFSSWIK